MATETDPQHRDPSTGRMSTGNLLTDTFSHVTNLVRGEIDLARAELQENVSKAFAAIGMLVAAIVILLTAFDVLAAALVAWLTALGLSAGWSALIVGGALVVLAVILGIVGRNRLTATSLAPTRSIENVRRDIRAAEGHTDGR